MPQEGIKLKRHKDIMSYEDIYKVTQVAAEIGITKVRITGGEPLVRLGVEELIEKIDSIPKIDEISLTTNGVSFPGGIIGNYDLTNSYQTIFRKDASSILYGNSYWKIEAREDADNIILLRVTLVDDGPESDSDEGALGGVDGGVKEPVTADVEFDFSARRANETIVTLFPDVTLLNSLG